MLGVCPLGLIFTRNVSGASHHPCVAKGGIGSGRLGAGSWKEIYM